MENMAACRGNRGIALSFVNLVVVGSESAVVGGDSALVVGNSALVGDDSAVVGGDSAELRV